MQKFRPVHPQDLEILKKKDREYSAYILATWLLTHEASEPVTRKKLDELVLVAKESSKDWVVLLAGKYHPIPLDHLEDAVVIADLYREDMIWRSNNLKLSVCSNGFDLYGFDQQGRNILLYMAEMYLEFKKIDLELKKKELELLI